MTSKRKKNYQKKFIEENELAYKTLNRLYECRNLEISNLWQRSAFLIGMLLLIYTGYGYLIFETFKKFNVDPKFIDLPANILGLAISCLGLVFSVLWIKMAKGSKAWYEVYEGAITELEYSLSDKFNATKGSFNAEQYVMGAMTLEKKDISNCWLDTKAGSYSPSKINIAIGQYSFIIWTTCILLHTVMLTWFILIQDTINTWKTPICITVIILSYIILLLLTALVLSFIRHIYIEKNTKHWANLNNDQFNTIISKKGTDIYATTSRAIQKTIKSQLDNIYTCILTKYEESGCSNEKLAHYISDEINKYKKEIKKEISNTNKKEISKKVQKCILNNELSKLEAQIKKNVLELYNPPELMSTKSSFFDSLL